MWWKATIPLQLEKKAMKTETTTWSEFPNGGKPTVEQILDDVIMWGQCNYFGKKPTWAWPLLTKNFSENMEAWANS